MPMNINVRQLCSLMCNQWELRQDVLTTRSSYWPTLFPQSIFWAQMDRSCSLTGYYFSASFFFALCLCVVSSSLLWQIGSAVTCCLQLCCHWSDLPYFPARMLLSTPSRLFLVTAACSSQMFLREIFVSPQPLMWFVWLNNKAEWFNGLSVWSSRFCLHIAHFSLGPIINLFQFLLALPTFHWPHHTLFNFFYLSNICY